MTIYAFFYVILLSFMTLPCYLWATPPEESSTETELFFLGDIYYDDQKTTLADSVLEIFEVSRQLSSVKNVSSTKPSKREISVTSINALLADPKKEGNHRQLKQLTLHRVDKDGTPYTVQLNEQLVQLVEEVKALKTAEWKTLQSDSQSVLNLIFEPEEHKFSKDRVTKFYDRLVDDNDKSIIPDTSWLYSQDQQVNPLLLCLSILAKPKYVVTTEKPKTNGREYLKRQRDEKDTPMSPTENGGSNKQNMFPTGYKIPKLKDSTNIAANESDPTTIIREAHVPTINENNNGQPDPGNTSAHCPPDQKPTESGHGSGYR